MQTLSVTTDHLALPPISHTVLTQEVELHFAKKPWQLVFSTVVIQPRGAVIDVVPPFALLPVGNALVRVKLPR